MSRSARAASGFSTSILQYACRIALQVLLAPLVLRLAGRETLGAYAVLMQAVALLTIVDFGLSFALERFLGRHHGFPDGGRRFRDTFTIGRTFLLLTNTIFAILLFLLSMVVVKLFSLSPAVGQQARDGLYILAIWAVLRTPITAFNTALIATQNLATANIIATVNNGLNLALSLLLLLGGGGLIGLMAASVLGEAASGVLCRHRFLQVHPECRPHWGIPDRPLLREMLVYGSHSIIINVAGILVYSSGSLLVGFLAGANAASIFYTTQMPALVCWNLVLRLADNSAPAIYELHGLQQWQTLRLSFLRLHRLTALLSVPLGAGILLFNHLVVSLWVGAQQYVGTLMTLSLAPFAFVVAFVHIDVIYGFAGRRTTLLTVTSCAEAILNVVLVILLYRKWGLSAIMLGTLLAVVPRTIFLHHALQRDFSIGWREFVREAGTPALGPVVISGMAAYLFEKLLGGTGWPTFIYSGLMFCAIYALLAYYFSLTPRDREEIGRYRAAIRSRLRYARAGGNT
jgi:O-antigen/teichoic acid export membrane protein